MGKTHRPGDVQVNVDLPRDLALALERFCDDARMTRKATVELALRKWLNDRRTDDRAHV